MLFFILLVLFILAIPFLLVLGFFHIVTVSFAEFGLSSGAVIAILLAMLIGSLINIPIGRRKLIEVEETHFFGLKRETKLKAHGLSINVGGAIVPMLLALYLLARAPLQETLLATALMTVICFMLARFVPGKGIALPMLFPALFALIFALVLAFDNAALVAFISGVFGVIIGADLLHLPDVMRREEGVMSIGGAGVFDGIFLVAIIASFLAGL